MHLSRESTLRIRKALDNGLPAVFRDSRVVMWPLLRLVLGRHARDFAEFKERAFDLSREEFADFYRRIEGSEVHGPTDLNAACAEAILREVRDRTVLEVGCGRGWLASRMADVAEHVTASDIIVSDATRSITGVTFTAADAEALPWPDRSFDVVVSTHTLEHVQALGAALAELRRVARERLVIVVPKERPFRYTFNPHLHFFPYSWSWRAVAGAVPGSRLQDLGDWFYTEPVQASSSEVGFESPPTARAEARRRDGDDQ